MKKQYNLFVCRILSNYWRIYVQRNNVHGIFDVFLSFLFLRGLNVKKYHSVGNSVQNDYVEGTISIIKFR